MKYLVILGDGMADRPIDVLGGKTPLEYASTPKMDELASKGEIGMVHTIPDGMKPGSDTANLSVLGYDPKKYYSGRSPLEALSIGVPMKDTDVALRCNIVTLSEEEDTYEKRHMIDHSSDEISTEDAAILLEAVKKELENDMFKFYVGTSYRHCLIWDKGEVVELSQPHDILGQCIEEYVPTVFGAASSANNSAVSPDNDSFNGYQLLYDMMKKSYDILVNHPINVERRAKGLHPANSCWFWGAGTKPALSSFEEKTGKKGAMISAVDLLKGIAVGASMTNIIVEGADGTLHTNYEGKARAAVEALTKDNNDFVYVHVEAPDEMGHQGSLENKIKAIEYLDEKVIKLVKEEMDKSGEDYRMLIMPDHPTPIYCRTHTSDPVPFMIYDSTKTIKTAEFYNEKEAKNSGIYLEDGYLIMNRLLEL